MERLGERQVLKYIGNDSGILVIISLGGFAICPLLSRLITFALRKQEARSKK